MNRTITIKGVDGHDDIDVSDSAVFVWEIR